MNLEEYQRRLERSHTFTGVPSYWEALQEMTEDRDRWKKIADGLYECANDRCPVDCVTGKYCPRDEYREAVNGE